MFEVHSSKKILHANEIDEIYDDFIVETYPYVVRKTQNNGVRGYIKEKKEFLNEGNTLSFAQDTFSVFYQEKPYFTGNKVKILVPLFTNFNKTLAVYFVSAFQKSLEKFTWGVGSTVESIMGTKIQLPTKDGEIDFVFMESFIAELEAYLVATGLSNYRLTKVEEEALELFKEVDGGGLKINRLQWDKFNIIDLFLVKNTFNILSRDIIENSGETPYLSASKGNNAISSYISYNKEFIDKGKCIFIGGKTFVVTYQEKDFYSNDSHNLCLYLKDRAQVNRLNHFFMITSIKKSLGDKYSWGDSISNEKIQSDTILLPTTLSGSPDFAFMENLISAIQKLVIKDVVAYADRKIAATRQIVEQQKTSAN